jgi:hypothetical protein
VVDVVDARGRYVRRGRGREKMGDGGEKEKHARLIVATARCAKEAALVGGMAPMGRLAAIRIELTSLVIRSGERGGSVRRGRPAPEGYEALQGEQADQSADNGARRQFPP